MQKSNEDCFYFLTSSCGKGGSCPFRHNPSAISCNVTCPAWLRGNCQDPACLFRHSNVQRSPANNGIVCHYEKTPMGCLKPHCTFVHLRPRPNARNSSTLRPSTTNLINQEAMRVPTTQPSPSPNSIANEPLASPSLPKVQSPAIVEKKPPAVVSAPSLPPPPVTVEKVEIPLRSVITAPAGKQQNGTAPSRLVGSRNVVVAAAESTSTSNRTIVHASSHRVVMKSSSQEQNKTKNDSDSDIDLDESIEQENNGRNMNVPLDILFPCSAPSITGRLFMTSKQTPPSTTTSNDNKPIRLNRDRLPASNVSSGTISTSSNEKPISAGPGLPPNDDRLTNRLERFKNTPSALPSTTSSNPIIPPREVITNERKRPSIRPSTDESPPSKRLSSSSTIGDLYSRREHARHHRRRSSPSPPRSMPTYSSSPSMNKSDWHQEVDSFLARTAQPKKVSLGSIAPPQLMPLLPMRPRYMPTQQPLAPPRPPYHQQQQNRGPRPRVVTATFFKRASAPGSSTPRPPPPPAAKPIETPSPTIVVPKVSTPPPAPPPRVPSPVNMDDEDELLGLDVNDPFALIDEILLETDDLPELL